MRPIVIDFNVDASLVQDYTRDVHRLQAALNKVKINTGFTSWRNSRHGRRSRAHGTGAAEPCFTMPCIFRRTTCWPRKLDARP